MDPKTLIETAVGLLAIAAVGGIVMAGMRFAGSDRPPSWLAMLHGLLAAAGLTLLLYAGFAGGMARLAWIGTALLVLAALGGLYLNLSFHDKRIPLPKNIIVIHAAIAVIGFLCVFFSL
jgi:glucose uptake protein GlcU